ncbi:hypothetical protein RCL_jg13319.t1 [Rhizophagus clarus]|uniref:Uncharacterized protein n=1 Tax=Rhizophagus clarus TaxID=94130 RepID=A0A8H3LQ94_9GLOM|nr:hypothetical protein RCL_jg13319.t1 [Rhizophagus clarus]
MFGEVCAMGPFRWTFVYEISFFSEWTSCLQGQENPVCSGDSNVICGSKSLLIFFFFDRIGDGVEEAVNRIRSVDKNGLTIRGEAFKHCGFSSIWREPEESLKGLSGLSLGEFPVSKELPDPKATQEARYERYEISDYGKSGHDHVTERSLLVKGSKVIQLRSNRLLKVSTITVQTRYETSTGRYHHCSSRISFHKVYWLSSYRLMMSQRRKEEKLDFTTYTICYDDGEY